MIRHLRTRVPTQQLIRFLGTGNYNSHKEVERIVQSTSHCGTLELSKADGRNKGKIKAAYLRLAKIVHPDVCDHPRANEAFARVQAANRMIESPYFPFKHHSYYGKYENDTEEDPYIQRESQRKPNHEQQKQRMHSHNNNNHYYQSRNNHDESDNYFQITPFHGIGLLVVAMILQLTISYIGTRSEHRRMLRNNDQNTTKEDENENKSYKQNINENHNHSKLLENQNLKDNIDANKNTSYIEQFFGKDSDVAKHQKISQIRSQEILKAGPLSDFPKDETK